MKIQPAVVGTVLFLLSTTAEADVLTVDVNGGGDFTTISRAIRAADDGDTIVVADGTYPSQGNSGMIFDGKEIVLTSANGPNHCRIDCENLARAFEFEGGETERTVVEGFTILNGFARDGGGILCSDNSSPAIRNCRFQKCRAERCGGGLACRGGSSPLVEDCWFNKCRADKRGGGLACEGDSNPSLRTCDFFLNFADSQGGAVYGHSSSPSLDTCRIGYNVCFDSGAGLSFEENSCPDLLNCQIGHNLAAGADSYGGGIFLRSSSPRLANTLIGCNQASRGGGVAVVDGELPFFCLCDIFQNTAVNTGPAGGYGGGVYLQECLNFPLFAWCRIRENLSESRGGGISSCFRGSGLICRCQVSSNEALHNGGIDISEHNSLIVLQTLVTENTGSIDGGGIGSDFASRPVIASCWILRNQALGAAEPADNGPGYYWESGCGGGILCWSDSARVINSVILGNEAASCGGGIYCYYAGEAVPSFRNCTVKDNSAALRGAGIYCWKDAERLDAACRISNSIFWHNSTNGSLFSSICGAAADAPLLEISNCDIQLGRNRGLQLLDGAAAETRAITDDFPEFLDDWHLDASRSPCIDAGDNSEVWELELDIDGTARVVGGRVEIGADETAGKVGRSSGNLPLPSAANDKTMVAALDRLKENLPEMLKMAESITLQPPPSLFKQKSDVEADLEDAFLGYLPVLGK